MTESWEKKCRVVLSNSEGHLADRVVRAVRADSPDPEVVHRRRSAKNIAKKIRRIVKVLGRQAAEVDFPVAEAVLAVLAAVPVKKSARIIA